MADGMSIEGLWVWSVMVVDKPKGFSPRSPEDRPRNYSSPRCLVTYNVTREHAERERQKYNRMSLRRGRATWAVETMDEELADAMIDADRAVERCKEHDASLMVRMDRWRIGDDTEVHYTVSFSSARILYGGEMTPEMAIAALRLELDELEAKLDAERLADHEAICGAF